MAKKTEKKIIVAYTDGSSLDGDGVFKGGSGTGIHGYAYDVLPSEQAKVIYKEMGVDADGLIDIPVKELPECIRDTEYMNTPKKLQKVKEISVNDLDLVRLECQYPQKGGTSNIAEMHGFIQLMLAPIKATERYIIHTDSNYLKQGVQEWMHGWKKRGWVKSNGGVVENLELWKKIYGLVKEVEDAGIQLDFRKIKGHSGRFGNEEADRLAGLASARAVNLQANGNVDPKEWLPQWDIDKYEFGLSEDDSKDEEAVDSKEETLSPKDEKKKAALKSKKIKDEDKLLPPPLRQKFLYMVGGERVPTVNVEDENFYRYYGGDHATLKDDRLLLGKAYPDSIQYITLMKEENETLQMTADEAHKRTWEGAPMMYRSNLVYLINGTFMNQEKFNRRFIEEDDMSSLTYNNEYNELMFDDQNWVAVACKPPMLSYRAMDLADTLTGWYTEFVKNKRESTNKYGVVEITEKFFDEAGKPTKFYRNIDKAIKLDAEVPGMGGKTMEVIVPRAIAIPDRTYLNRLAKFNLKMYLVSKKETKNAFRYFLILETDISRQLIISYHSSLRIFA